MQHCFITIEQKYYISFHVTSVVLKTSLLLKTGFCVKIGYCVLVFPICFLKITLELFLWTSHQNYRKKYAIRMHFRPSKVSTVWKQQCLLHSYYLFNVRSGIAKCWQVCYFIFNRYAVKTEFWWCTRLWF